MLASTRVRTNHTISIIMHMICALKSSVPGTTGSHAEVLLYLQPPLPSTEPIIEHVTESLEDPSEQAAAADAHNHHYSLTRVQQDS